MSISKLINKFINYCKCKCNCSCIFGDIKNKHKKHKKHHGEHNIKHDK